jgi:hypothetical protein
VFQAHRQSPILGSLQSAPEARALSSASITRPPRSYGPLRLPSDPPPLRRWGCQPRSRRVSPDYAHHPSNVPCPIPRRIEAGACVDCFPAHAAFPVSQAGRHPHLHFRDLLRLHSRYGPLDCSAAQGGLCHEAPARSVTRPNRSSATGAIDNSPGGILLHWCYAPSGRTGKFWQARPAPGARWRNCTRAAAQAHRGGSCGTPRRADCGAASAISVQIGPGGGAVLPRRSLAQDAAAPSHLERFGSPLRNGPLQPAELVRAAGDQGTPPGRPGAMPPGEPGAVRSVS